MQQASDGITQYESDSENPGVAFIKMQAGDNGGGIE
jgi:hypothetical protein